ncbi:hypothetical protein PIB30_067653 [Stylosanthes scabra]|uniref:Uncharacterized protein n=1 Tax=Stylosanthes scabra TaxID=79078 RepID=A0ABU6SP31_9FABA|nr:hypothetical protein [Stylosanthes scabra]
MLVRTTATFKEEALPHHMHLTPTTRRLSCHSKESSHGVLPIPEAVAERAYLNRPATWFIASLVGWFPVVWESHPCDPHATCFSSGCESLRVGNGLSDGDVVAIELLSVVSVVNQR